MKLTVTKKELLALCSKALGCEVSEIVVSKDFSPAKLSDAKLSDRIVKMFQDDGYLDAQGQILPHQKIEAIKFLRNTIYPSTAEKGGIGLGQAKWTIEHWDEFVAFITKNRRLPKVTMYADIDGTTRNFS